jgi:hypothetical protein
MKNTLFIFLILVSILTACQPSNIKMLQLAPNELNTKVKVVFNGYDKVVLHKRKGFGNSTIYDVTSIDSFIPSEACRYYGFSLSINVDKDEIKKSWHYYADNDIPDVSMKFSSDSTMLSIDQLFGAQHFTVLRQIGAYSVSVYSNRPPEDKPFTNEEIAFFEKIILSISILE